MSPLLEIMSQSVSRGMQDHSFEEIRLKVFFVGPNSQIVERYRKFSSYQSFKDVKKIGTAEPF